MQFYVDEDVGTHISGWIAPDNPTETPKIRIVQQGLADIVIAANILRDDIRDLGMHATGLVGFKIDSNVLPDIDTADDVEIRDVTTDTFLYKRFKINNYTDKRVLFFDLYAMPQRRIINTAKNKFALHHHNIEKYSLETLSCILSSPFNRSVFCSGRPYFSRYIEIIRNMNFYTFALFRDPFQELAEKLLVLRFAAQSGNIDFLSTLAPEFAPLVALAQDLPVDDERGLRTVLRSLTREQRDVLSNPYTRVFGCTAGENPEHRHVGIALENLSTLSAIGLQSRYPDFAGMVNGVLEAPVFDDATPVISKIVDDLASRLARVSVVTNLLEHDLALYSYVEEAVVQGLTSA